MMDESSEAAPAGGLATLMGEEVYRISSFDHLPPFLISLTGESDCWAFVSSRGGLTAGRVDAEGALFPYETEDKLHHGHHHTGPRTLVRMGGGNYAGALWEPFTDHADEVFSVQRNLYKSVLGNRLIFEEVNETLGLVFRYRLATAGPLGLVRTSMLTNTGTEPVSLAVFDALRNVLPFGAPLGLYQSSSSLVDAYKRSELLAPVRLAIYSLTAAIVDRAEAAEMLRANVVWSTGLPAAMVTLSSEAEARFRDGEPAPRRDLSTGERGHYATGAALELEANATHSWHLVADAGLDQGQIAALANNLASEDDLGATIEEALQSASRELTGYVAESDGLQQTADRIMDAHHLANTLFNIMRGGVFFEGHHVPLGDFRAFLRQRNRPVAERHGEFLSGLGNRLAVTEMLARVRERDDADLERLAYEYLPLHFGRRHGDPSRPWNRFAIQVQRPDGSRALNYEGNWRDIFQNWEALALSYPAFLPSMVAKFVNASTVDGFNPYRVTREGIEWEVDDPEEPWSNIGYWGDHQIIYLCKLLEATRAAHPGALEQMLDRDVFSYADVPYRLRPYEQLLADSKSTIEFDHAQEKRVEERVAQTGSDGKLLHRDGAVVHVNLAEKLLVPVMSKLSNLIPGAGIWMNTQRPEWNDANNALVGNGVSMVTLYYLRRHLKVLEGLFREAARDSLPVAEEVAAWFAGVHTALKEAAGAGASDRDRKKTMDALGTAFCAYRRKVYAGGFGGRTDLPVSEVLDMMQTAEKHLDRAIEANRRDDGLYHAYNILVLGDDHDSASVERLTMMLEGQVAALSSGAVGPEETAALIDAMYESPLYRRDQNSFLLYPERILPSFMEKNVVPEPALDQAPLLYELIEAGDVRLVKKDVGGVVRFHGDVQNADDISRVLDVLAEDPRWHEQVVRDREAVLDVFEAVFRHRSFTGRSGTMYGFEGIGCVYWHMVAKLLLALQEVALREPDGPLFKRLAKAYYRVRGGLGFEKTVAEYGAFPTDPYSHTAPDGGARQPGMTGQVKEEILTRFGELGVSLDRGIVSFNPRLLRHREFQDAALEFTYCAVPIRYILTVGEGDLRVVWADGREETAEGLALTPEQSGALLARDGRLALIEAAVPEARMLRDPVPVA